MLARVVMTENGPKSAYELAMERLRKKDAESGVVAGPVSHAQKSEIAEVRQIAEALEAEYRRDVQRVTDDRERKIAKIRERPA